MRELRKTIIEGEIFLYPFPVDKDKKYLILCLSSVEVDKLLQGIINSKLIHPDISFQDFVFVKLHTDRNTKIYRRRI